MFWAYHLLNSALSLLLINSTSNSSFVGSATTLSQYRASFKRYEKKPFFTSSALKVLGMSFNLITRKRRESMKINLSLKVFICTKKKPVENNLGVFGCVLPEFRYYRVVVKTKHELLCTNTHTYCEMPRVCLYSLPSSSKRDLQNSSST